MRNFHTRFTNTVRAAGLNTLFLSRVFLMSAISAVVLQPLTGWSSCADDYLGESCEYSYRLVLNRSPKLCNHMAKVLKGSFRHPFDFSKFDRSQLEWTEKRPPMNLIHPTSPEFDAIPWRFPKIFGDDQKATYWLPVSVVDIDNDGHKDTVIKSVLNGDGRTGEVLTIFRGREINLDSLITNRQLSSGWPDRGAIPVVFYGGLQVRLFAIDGVIYVLQYTAKTPNKGQRVNSQAMTISTLKARVTQNSEPDLQAHDICKFQMTRNLKK